VHEKREKHPDEGNKMTTDDDNNIDGKIRERKEWEWECGIKLC